MRKTVAGHEEYNIDEQLTDNMETSYRTVLPNDERPDCNDDIGEQCQSAQQQHCTVHRRTSLPADGESTRYEFNECEKNPLSVERVARHHVEQREST